MWAHVREDELTRRTHTPPRNSHFSCPCPQSQKTEDHCVLTSASPLVLPTPSPHDKIAQKCLSTDRHSKARTENSPITVDTCGRPFTPTRQRNRARLCHATDADDRLIPVGVEVYYRQNISIRSKTERQRALTNIFLHVDARQTRTVDSH